MPRTPIAYLLVLGLAGAGHAQIVDHTAIDGVAALPQSVMDAIGQQRWLFTHASVGGNMVSGLATLNGGDPTRYQLIPTWVGFNDGEQRAVDPPIPTLPGRVYECDRGNPGWSAKLTIFENSIELSGWSFPAVDVALDKLCYIDEAADSSAYIATMTALETSAPDTVFVYITMPLTTEEDSANVLRNQYNQAVRNHCLANGRLLFDLADMEAHDPNGAEQTFLYQGQTYQKLFAGYTDDGGHLNSVGQPRIARGWYAVAAVLAHDPIFADGFESGDTSDWSVTVP